MTEYHFDGLRIDAVHGIFDFSARHILLDINEEVQRQAKNLGRHIAVIAESDLNDARVIDPPVKGGYGLDAQWNDDFHHCLHTLLAKERNGYYQDFGDIRQMVKAFREGFVYTGQYSSFRRRRHGNSSKHLPSTKFVVFSQNHDQVGNRAKGDRLSTLVSFEALKLAAGIVLLSPNIPLLFMGEEYGEETPFQYFVSHSDQELIEAVRSGRREEFAAFSWKCKLPDPQDEATFLRSKIQIDRSESGRHKVLLGFYKTFVKLRKDLFSLSPLSKWGLKVKALENNLVIFMRHKDGPRHVFCSFNFGQEIVETEPFVEKGLWRKRIDSSSDEWGGPGSSMPKSIVSGGFKVSFKLNPLSFVLYECPHENS